LLSRLWLLLLLLLLLWLLLLLLPLLLLLFLFCEMMPDSATGRCANDAMMASHVPCHAPYNGTLDATFRLGTVRADQEHKAHQGCAKRLHLHCHTPRHTITPSLRPRICGYPGSTLELRPWSLHMLACVPNVHNDQDAP
jgi:hypothetical protein